MKTNIDTFKSYETIEFEKEDEDYLKVKDWDIMINNFGLIKPEIYACKEASTKNKDHRIKYLWENLKYLVDEWKSSVYQDIINRQELIIRNKFKQFGKFIDSEEPFVIRILETIKDIQPMVQGGDGKSDSYIDP